MHRPRSRVPVQHIPAQHWEQSAQPDKLQFISQNCHPTFRVERDDYLSYVAHNPDLVNVPLAVDGHPTSVVQIKNGQMYLPGGAPFSCGAAPLNLVDHGKPQATLQQYRTKSNHENALNNPENCDTSTSAPVGNDQCNTCSCFLAKPSLEIEKKFDWMKTSLANDGLHDFILLLYGRREALLDALVTAERQLDELNAAEYEICQDRQQPQCDQPSFNAVILDLANAASKSFNQAATNIHSLFRSLSRKRTTHSCAATNKMTPSRLPTPEKRLAHQSPDQSVEDDKIPQHSPLSSDPPRILKTRHKARFDCVNRPWQIRLRVAKGAIPTGHRSHDNPCLGVQPRRQAHQRHSSVPRRLPDSHSGTAAAADASQRTAIAGHHSYQDSSTVWYTGPVVGGAPPQRLPPADDHLVKLRQRRNDAIQETTRRPRSGLISAEEYYNMHHTAQFVNTRRMHHQQLSSMISKQSETYLGYHPAYPQPFPKYANGSKELPIEPLPKTSELFRGRCININPDNDNLGQTSISAIHRDLRDCEKDNLERESPLPSYAVRVKMNSSLPVCIQLRYQHVETQRHLHAKTAYSNMNCQPTDRVSTRPSGMHIVVFNCGPEKQVTIYYNDQKKIDFRQFGVRKFCEN